jgi:hypothetical protein
MTVQNTAFLNELQDLFTNLTPSRRNELVALNAFIDEEDIIRVRGRLAHSEIRYEQKHPGTLSQI